MTITLTREATQTECVLADMLTENTGRHMLDSGGAYGRNWERNQGAKAEDFLAAPAVRFDGYGDDVWPIVDLFHFLRDRLEFDPRMNRAFELWVALRNEPDDPWLVEAEEFAEAWNDRGYGVSGATSHNSYNGESYLSQVIQWAQFERDGEHYAVLQIHGGCDVRGGYTKPRVFRMYGDYALHYEDVHAGCTFNPGPVVSEQLALAGEAEQLHANGECPLGMYSVDYRCPEVSVYVYGRNGAYDTDLYGDDCAPYLPTWDDEERRAVCRGCGSPFTGDLMECPY